ncbi:MAG: DUF3772 domain-containing protein, partial [Pseudomonadota bacterium]
ARSELEQTRQDLAELLDQQSAALAPLLAEREALGAPPEDGTEEAPEIATQRALLDETIARFETVQKRALQAQTRIGALGDTLTDLRRRMFTAELFTRQPSPVNPDRVAGAHESFGLRGAAIEREIRARAGDAPVIEVLTDRLALPILMFLVALALTFWVRGWIVKGLLASADEELSNQRKLALDLALLIARAALPALGLILVAQALRNSGLLGPNGLLLLDGATWSLSIAIGAYALSAAYFAPSAPALRISTLGDDKARRAHRWVSALAAIVVLDRLLVGSGNANRLTIDALALVNAVLLVLGGLILWRLIKAIRVAKREVEAEADEDLTPDEQPPWQPLDSVGRLMRFVALVASVLAPVLALVGYYGASRFVFYPVVYSAAVLGICALVYHAARFYGRGAVLEGEAAEVEPATLLQVIAGILLAFIAAPILAGIWGAGEADLLAAWSALVDGFSVGTVTIAPMDFMIFAVVFIAGYTITRMLQAVLRRSVLPAVRLDEGVQSALLAGIGYIGIGIAALVAISTTGLDLSNLAIVAGALSVGIGFGLQNVVNNFVSGIILLIERPIKAGDWVEINGAHGTVKRVKVRSTEIQKFDRSTMFVPNADLISGTVINWTHGDSLGRLIVSVGAAYGSDARQVERVLLQIAQANPMLARRPAPYILFTGFGADSIDFEVRGVLRDVNNIMTAASEIRFAIYEKFAEEGIEIPFAQRDLNFRNVEELGAAFRGDPVPVRAEKDEKNDDVDKRES